MGIMTPTWQVVKVSVTWGSVVTSVAELQRLTRCSKNASFIVLTFQSPFLPESAMCIVSGGIFLKLT